MVWHGNATTAPHPTSSHPFISEQWSGVMPLTVFSSMSALASRSARAAFVLPHVHARCRGESPSRSRALTRPPAVTRADTAHASLA
eukprot:6203318-Pleurochrysis_carterae.AAC.2